MYQGIKDSIPVLQDWCNPSERERAARNNSSRFPVLCSPLRQQAGGLEGDHWGFCSTGRTSPSGWLAQSTSHSHCQHFSKVGLKFSFFYLMQDDPAITCEIRRQELGRSHGLERVWRLRRLWARLQEMASDVADHTRRHARWHELMRWWRRREVLSRWMDHRGLEEVSSSLSHFEWSTSVQVFLRTRGDRPTHPELHLPRRSPVPWIDSPRLAPSQNILPETRFGQFSFFILGLLIEGLEPELHCIKVAINLVDFWHFLWWQCWVLG